MFFWFPLAIPCCVENLVPQLFAPDGNGLGHDAGVLFCDEIVADGLHSIGDLGSAHGVGLMLGVKCKVPNLEMMTKTREAGLLTVIAADDFLRFLPPLVIEESHVDEAIAVLDEVAANWGGDG